MTYLATAKEALSALRAHCGPELEGLRADEPNLYRQLPTPEGAASMTLDQFANAGLILHVCSTVVGDIAFVSDDVPQSRLVDLGLPVYRVRELRKLAILKPRPHSLRTIREAKMVFNGTLGNVKDLEKVR